MFGYVFGEEGFRREIQHWVDEIDRTGGGVPIPEIATQFFFNARPIESRHAIRRLMESQDDKCGVMVAYIVLLLGWSGEIRREAIAFLLSYAQGGDDEKCFAMHIVAGLESLPDDFIELVEGGLDAESVELKFMSATLVPLLATHSDERQVKGVEFLSTHFHGDDQLLRVQAAFALASYAIRIEQTAELLLEICESSPENVVTIVAMRLAVPFRRVPKLLGFLKKRAASDTHSVDHRITIYRNLGRLGVGDVEMQAWLIDEFDRNSRESEDPWLVLGIAYGLILQRLDLPKEFLKRVLARLDDENVEMRKVISLIVVENAEKLGSAEFAYLADIVLKETDDHVREKILQTFRRGGSCALTPLMDVAKHSSKLMRFGWFAVLGEHLERDPARFLELYKENWSPALSEAMPFVLSNIPVRGQSYLEALKRALSSKSELERANALMALRSSDKDAASVTPELLDLYMHGSSEEQQAAENVLLNIGIATRKHLAEYHNVHGQEELAKFQRLQRLIGIDENSVLHADLQRFAKPDFVRGFVIAAEVYDAHGPISQKKVQEILIENGVSDLPESTWRRHIRLLEKFLSGLDPNGNPVFLLQVKGNRPQSLSEEGKEWLARCRSYLRAIEARSG